MKLSKFLFSALLAVLLFFAGCKPKDADIKANVEEKLKTNTEMATPASVSVTDGVATLTGECKDEACKSKCAELASSANGVKSVVNNMSVPAPVTINTDDALTTGAKQAVAAYNGVSADVSGGIVTLRGSITRDNLTKLMQSITALQPKSINNELQVK